MKPIVIVAIAAVAMIGVMGFSINYHPMLEENQGLYLTYLGLVNSCLEKSSVNQCESQKQEFFDTAKLKVGDTEKELNDFPDMFETYSGVAILKEIEFMPKPEPQTPITTPSGFDNLECKRGLFDIIELTGTYKNSNKYFKSIWMTMLVRDNNGFVVATGSGQIKDVKANSVRTFTATANWDAPFYDCLVQINSLEK
jgi:hypothetical protein